ncbi:hypothetical protein ACKLTP_18590, partial [Paenarthrobacter ureafaciens]
THLDDQVAGVFRCGKDRQRDANLDYIGQLHGPFPQMQLIPSGGITIEDAPRWISAGALAVSLGGPLLGDAFDGGSLAQLTERARRVTELVSAATEDRKGTNR